MPPGDRSIDPGELLRSALEKIVFFECKVAQLESELAAARQVAERARADAAQARQREAELGHQVAEAASARAGLQLRDADLAERVRLLETERERLMAGLVERARVGGAAGDDGSPGPEEGGADLAGFISELRAEIEQLRSWKAEASAAGSAGDVSMAVEPSVRRAAAAPLAELAGDFRSAGRTGLSAVDVAQLQQALPLRSDRLLHERAMVELGATEAATRRRAIRQLEVFGARASAPLLAAALGREPDAEVKVALLEALARLKEPFAADLAARELSDLRPAVRAAALETHAALAEGAALPRLAAALSDSSPLVRRRAAVLLGFARGAEAEDALAGALRDPDRGVARAAAAALAGRPSARAQGALARALETAEPTVRRAVAGTLAAWSGEAVDGDAAEPDRRRVARRISERLAALGCEGLRDAVLRAAPPALTRAQARPPAQVSTRPPTPTPNSTPNSTPTAAAAPTPTSTQPRARTAVAVLEAASAPIPAGGGSELEEALVAELRSSLRGRSAEELHEVTGAPAPRIDAALEVLRSRGTLTRRGARWHVA